MTYRLNVTSTRKLEDADLDAFFAEATHNHSKVLPPAYAQALWNKLRTQGRVVISDPTVETIYELVREN